MSWPSTDVNNTNVDASGDNPDLARVDLKDLIDKFNAVRQFKGDAEVDIASAATTTIGASEKVRITGTTTITSLGTNYVGPVFIRFAGNLVLTHNATTLICPGNQSIPVNAGDTAIAVPKASAGTPNGWQIVAFQRAAIQPQVQDSFTPGLSFNGLTTGITYAIQAGSYAIVGNFMVVTGYIALTNKGSAVGSVLITGLPAVPVSGNRSLVAGSIAGLSSVTYQGMVQLRTNGIAASLVLEQTTEAGVVSPLNNGNFANNSQLMFSCMYPLI